MKNIILSVILTVLITYPLFGQSSDENRFAIRTAFVAHSLTYNLDKQNAFGFQLGQFSTEINQDNIQKIEKSFYGFNYAYAYECINCDSFFVVTFLNNGSSVITAYDGSTYSYSGWGLSVVGGYSWYLENNISIVLGAGPLYSGESKESEDIKSDNGYGTDADERMEKLSFLPLVPLLFVGYSF